MSIDPGINDLLEGGARALSWDAKPVGHTYKGTVVAAKKTQQTDFATKKPKFYDDGNPMMQIVITLATDQRDAGGDDDGHRNLFVRGQMLQALREALKATPGLAEGGEIAVQFTGEEPSGKGNPKKLYRVQYKQPSATPPVNVDDLF